MAYWWSNLDGEDLFMEVTRVAGRGDFGSALNAPLSARGGVETAGYALVSVIGAGSRVVHYDGGTKQIVGVSRATGERYDQPIWWASRGNYARRAGVTARWLPGYSVALAGYTPLAPPLPISAIRERRDAILGLRAELQALHRNQPLYFPWTPYGDTLSTFQTYLAKFPAAALDILPEVAAAFEVLTDAEAQPAEGHPELDEAERDLATAAGRPRPARKGKGQGFVVDSVVKVAIEAHAMNAARVHYEAIGVVTNKSRTESYDYVVLIDGEEWHVEVKGTSGDIGQVLLTPNEVDHARDYPCVALFVLSNIEVVRDDDGVRMGGGRPTILHPWELDASRLTPVGYRYWLA